MNLQNSALYILCAFLVVADLVAGYLHILPMDTATTTFVMIVGTLVGIHIPVPGKTITTP